MVTGALYLSEAPPLSQTLFVGENKWTFSRPYSWQWEGAGGWSFIRRQAWVCPHCLTVWAQSGLTGLPPEDHEITAALCESCGDGSLLNLWGGRLRDPALLDFGPPELIHREFDLALKKGMQHAI